MIITRKFVRPFEQVYFQHILQEFFLHYFDSFIVIPRTTMLNQSV